MSQFPRTPLSLIPTVQHYAWGRLGSDSLVGRLSGQAIDEAKPYAELWLGAHPTAPATAVVENQKIALNKLIEKHPEQLLGASAYKRFGAVLPFLFKVLSIRTPLSIQLHPDKGQAKLIHAEDPKHYPDANHKPEISIALGQAALLSGFRTVGELATLLRDVPELGLFCGETRAASIKDLFQVVSQASSELIRELSTKLYRRLRQKTVTSDEDKWILSLEAAYPDGDVGLFSFYLLNFIKRSGGQAVFSPARNPHAYLEGELIECMANSDNTVRIGLTSKYCDLKRMLEIVDYSMTRPELIRAEPVDNEPWGYYQTPAEEFRLSVLSGEITAEVASTDSVELLFSVDAVGELGQRYPLSPGSAYLVPAAAAALELKLKRGDLYRVTLPS